MASFCYFLCVLFLFTTLIQNGNSHDDASSSSSTLSSVVKGSSTTANSKHDVSSPKYNGASVHPAQESGSSDKSTKSGKPNNASDGHDR